MKRILFVLFFFSIALIINAQSETAKSETHYIYASIYMQNGFNVDYGKELRDSKYRTPDGKKAKTLVSVINNMAVEGWEVVTSHVVAGLEVVIMRKAVTKEEQQNVADAGKKDD